MGAVEVPGGGVAPPGLKLFVADSTSTNASPAHASAATTPYATRVARVGGPATAWALMRAA